MEKVILVFVKLKKNIDKKKFEAFEHRVSEYNINLQSHKNFTVLRAEGILGNDTVEAPYDYIEIITTKSLEALYKTVEGDNKIKAFMAEFSEFAESSQFLITESVLCV